MKRIPSNPPTTLHYLNLPFTRRISLNIHTPSQTHTLRISPESTVHELHSQIASLLRISQSSIQLIYQQQLLPSASTLASLRIPNNANITLVVKIQSGRKTLVSPKSNRNTIFVVSKEGEELVVVELKVREGEKEKVRKVLGDSWKWVSDDVVVEDGIMESRPVSRVRSGGVSRIGSGQSVIRPKTTISLARLERELSVVEGEEGRLMEKGRSAPLLLDSDEEWDWEEELDKLLIESKSMPDFVTQPPLSPGKIIVKNVVNELVRAKSISNEDDEEEKKLIRTKELHCEMCKKKLRITNSFECKCGKQYCGMHRYANKHSCTFDYKVDKGEGKSNRKEAKNSTEKTCRQNSRKI